MNADYSKLYLLIAAVAALAALVSATAAIAIAILTRRLTRATETYASLVRDELALLKVQLETPLAFDIQLAYPYCHARCRHFGSSNSLPVRVRRVELQLELVDKPGSVVAKDERLFEDYLAPGKSWGRHVGDQVATRMNQLRNPNFFAALLRKGQKEKMEAILTARLDYDRAGEPKSLVREYEVWTHWWRTPRLKPIAS